MGKEEPQHIKPADGAQRNGGVDGGKEKDPIGVRNGGGHNQFYASDQKGSLYGPPLIGLIR
jgi:hypothetical protein